MIVSMGMLLYVSWHVGAEAAGATAGWAVVGAFLAFEALLFWGTRPLGEG